MKRIGGLFEQNVERDNLQRALWCAARGKRHRERIREVMDAPWLLLEDIQKRVSAGCWRFGPYESFEVRDTKSRTIHAPPFRDRVLHHAIIAIAGPVFERGALPTSYACRAGRGQHRALDAAREHIRRATWYGKMDVRRFYDSVDHAVLRRLLARRFRERRLLHLFDQLLRSYCTGPGKGLPIGALTSQYLGNFLLDEFDRQVLQDVPGVAWLRYMDDVLVFGSKSELDRVRSSACRRLDGLGLELKHGGEWNRVARGVPFLGFVLYADRTRLNRTGRSRLRRKTRAVWDEHVGGTIDDLETQARLTALFAHASWADDVAWRRSLVSSRAWQADEGERDELERDEQQRKAWDRQEQPEARPARRRLEQHGQELPFGVSQQEQARQPQRQHRFPGGAVPRHERSEKVLLRTDDAGSSSPPPGGDEVRGKTLPWTDIRLTTVEGSAGNGSAENALESSAEDVVEKGHGEAPP